MRRQKKKQNKKTSAKTASKRKTRINTELENAYHALIEQSNEGLVILQNEKIIFSNRAMGKILNLNVNDIVGRPMTYYLAPRYKKTLAARYRSRIRGRKEPELYEAALVDRDGQEIPVEFSAGLIEYQEQPTVLVRIRDITERKQMEDELRASESKYRTVVENSGVTISMVNRNGEYLFVNKLGARTMGTTPKKLVGKTIHQLFRGQNANGRLAVVRRVIDSGNSEEFESVIEINDKNYWHRVNVQPVKGRRKKTDRALVVGVDITERKKAEKQLQQLEQMRKEYLSNVSHQFKTPLTTIRGYAETLLNGAYRDPETCYPFLQTILDNAVRMSKLTEDLLRLGLLEEGQIELEMSEISLPDLLERSVETVRIKAEEKNITLKTSASKSVPMVYADSFRMLEILQNLLENAIQYSPEGSRISLRASRRGKHAVISVADHGMGIPEAEQRKIFDRFYRSDTARMRVATGTGLGLAIVKNLIEAHHGHIEVESEPDKGSTFKVYIPEARRGPKK